MVMALVAVVTVERRVMMRRNLVRPARWTESPRFTGGWGSTSAATTCTHKAAGC
jgi:hypothetical protein